MIYSSSLTDDRRPLVLDTSVLINLYACSYGERILTAIPNRIIVPEDVARELEHATSRKNGGHDFLRSLITQRMVTLSSMTEVENTLFSDLASGTGSLGDGEAATIAVAAERQFLPLIDDAKARARAIDMLRGEVPGWSLDLFLHGSVISRLPGRSAIDALYLALRHGRMRVPAKSTEYLIDVLGIDRARCCTCLPNYRKIFGPSTNRHVMPV